MREPVTSILSSVVASCWPPSCALANAGANAIAMPAGSRPKRTAVRKLRWFIYLSPEKTFGWARLLSLC
jgi:hypothetical protein